MHFKYKIFVIYFYPFFKPINFKQGKKIQGTRVDTILCFNSFMFILLGKVQEILAIISLRYVYTYLHRKKYQLRFTVVLYTVFTFTAFLIQIQIII